MRSIDPIRFDFSKSREAQLVLRTNVRNAVVYDHESIRSQCVGLTRNSGLLMCVHIDRDENPMDLTRMPVRNTKFVQQIRSTAIVSLVQI
jgi:hypothetical protein